MKRKVILFLLLFLFVIPVSAQTIKNGDVNGDGQVTALDIKAILSQWITSTTGAADQFGDGRVNALDMAVVTDYLNGPPTSPSPVPSSSTQTSEWTQFGHDAQRTSYTSQAVATPWRYKWQWNGAGADGKKQAGHLSSARLVQPITGGGRIYTVAGDQVFALNRTDGSILWFKGSLGTLSSAPAYTQEAIFIASQNNTLYKLRASDGGVLGSFTAASALSTAPLIVGNSVYVVATNGTLYKVNATTMAKVWEYAGGSPGATTISYSPSRAVLIYITQDLYVHAVNDATGMQKWRVKPTVRTYSVADSTNNLTEAINGWPVIAEQHGIVFVRYRLEWQTLWNGPSPGGTFPDLNSDARNFLIANPRNQTVFAMKLDDGTSAFIPNVGNAGAGDGGTLPMGTQPVVSTIDGKEVVYIVFRNRQNCARFNYSYCDGRSDAIMGEMVLDNSTVAGYVAGDVRIVEYEDIRTDEAMYASMSDRIVFHSHWLVNAAAKITDRSASRGSTFANSILTDSAPFVIWRQCNGTNTCNYPGCTGNTYCGINCAVNTSRYCSQGLYSYGDARSYPPGFYEYNNDMSGGSTPFTVVSDGLVLVKTNDGAVMAFESGNPTAQGTNDSGAVAGAISDVQTLTYSVEPTTPITSQAASEHLSQVVTVRGRIQTVENHRPKAIYLGFGTTHTNDLLVRVFEKDMSKFDSTMLMNLEGKTIEVTGLVTTYWPYGISPEIVVTEPEQLKVLE